MDAVVPLLIILPILGMIGGLTLAVLRTLGRQRQIELLQRERIAALEHGVDPQKLPSLGALGLADTTSPANDPTRRMAQNLLVAGVICVALGAGLIYLFLVVEEHGESWALGVVPVSLGIGMLMAAGLVRPRGKPPASEE